MFEMVHLYSSILSLFLMDPADEVLEYAKLPAQMTYKQL